MRIVTSLHLKQGGYISESKQVEVIISICSLKGRPKLVRHTLNEQKSVIQMIPLELFRSCVTNLFPVWASPPASTAQMCAVIIIKFIIHMHASTHTRTCTLITR